MPDLDDISDAIAQAADDGIASVTVDGQTTVTKSIDEQIKAAQFVARETAKDKPGIGLRFFKLVPPGGG